jgi:5-methylcytosine-specific restriction endonuclease McrA
MKNTNHITKKELKRLEKKEVKRKDEEWKLAVFKKYGKMCILSGKTKYVQVHHVFPKKAYPKLRWVIENGVPLERSLHFRFERLKEFDILYQIIIHRGLKWLIKLRKKL